MDTSETVYISSLALLKVCTACMVDLSWRHTVMYLGLNMFKKCLQTGHGFVYRDLVFVLSSEG